MRVRVATRMQNTDSLYRKLNFFAESCSIESEPRHNLFYRVLMLRILYSLSNIGIDDALDLMQQNAVGIGGFNKPVIDEGMKHGIFRLDYLEWVQLICEMNTTDFHGLCEYIQQDYGENRMMSPFLRFREHLESKVKMQGKMPGSVVVRLYLLIMNAEIDVPKAILHLLTISKMENSVNTVFDIMGASIATQNHAWVSKDAVAVLGHLEVCNLNVLQRRVENIAHCIEKRAPADADSQKCPGRPSMLLQLATRRRMQASVPAKSGDISQPPDFPLGHGSWSRLSKTEKQVVLMLCMVRRASFDNFVECISYYVGQQEAEKLLYYEVTNTRAEEVYEQIMPLFTRMYNSIDANNVVISSLIHNFSDLCLADVLGERQRKCMSLGFLMHLYVSAFFPRSIQCIAFGNVTSAFNRRVPADLRVQENLSGFTCDTLAAFASENQIAKCIISEVFQRLCV